MLLCRDSEKKCVFWESSFFVPARLSRHTHGRLLEPGLMLNSVQSSAAFFKKRMNRSSGSNYSATTAELRIPNSQSYTKNRMN